MAIVRWDPFREFEDMQRRFQNIAMPTFNESLTRADWAPLVDISESPEAYMIHAELPEVRKEDVRLAYNEGVLTLSGERRHEKEDKNRKFHRVERSYGRFERSFSLPNTIDAKKITATYNNGVLNVMIPKVAPQPSTATEIKIG